MIRTGNGIIAAQDGQTINDDLAYDSRKSHLIVDTAPAAKHLGILEMKAGDVATTYTFAAGGSRVVERWSIPHGLPFIPRVGVYMFVRDAGPQQASFIGEYSSIISVSSFPIEDVFYYRVDATHLRLMYRFTVRGTPNTTGNHTSMLQDMLLRIKYMIFNNVGSDEPYEGEFYGL